MAALEGEAMLLGHWKNIEELENSLNLNELEIIIKASRDKEHREQKFLAALKGVDIDAESGTGETGEEALERIKKRAAARAMGLSADAAERHVEYEEFKEFGFEVETE